MKQESPEPRAGAWLVALALADGFLSSAMFAPLAFAPLAFLTGTLTLFAVRRLSLPLAAAAAYLYGISLSIFTVYWVYEALYVHYEVSFAASVAFTFFVAGCGVGFFLGAPIFLWRLLNGRAGEDRLPLPWRVLSAAALFAIFEWLRTHGSLSMPWGLIGAGVAGSEILSQGADLFGVIGFSFVSMLFSALLLEAIDAFVPSRDWRALVRDRRFQLAAAIPVVLYAYGAARYLQIGAQLESAEGKTLEVAGIQANIPQGERWEASLVARNMNAHIELSARALEGNDVDLVIWPETAMNTYITQPGDSYQRRIHDLAMKHNAEFLLGGPHYVDEGGKPQFYNSIFLLRPLSRISARYDKRQLLAFAEYTPLAGSPFFPTSEAVPDDYSPGDKPGIFDVKGVKIGAMICFEALYPWLARDLVSSGAEVLVNISNDAWFQRSKAATQHVQQARLRAIELRRYLIRNAGTGISAIYDPLGRVVAGPIPIFEEGILRGKVRALSGMTLYSLWGEWPVLLLSWGILVGIAAFRRRFV